MSSLIILSISLSVFLEVCYDCFVYLQILKDGMQHVGKLICSNLGARMDSEPKRWRILGLHDVHGALCYAVILLISLKELLLHELILLLAFLCHIIKILIILAFYTAADVLYDLGTGLEVMSPLCPHLFLEVAGLGNFAKVSFSAY